MRVTFMKIPGNGEKHLDFPGSNSVSVQAVLEKAATTYNLGNLTQGNEIAVNGTTIDKSVLTETKVYPGDLVSATGVVKGAICKGGGKIIYLGSGRSCS